MEKWLFINITNLRPTYLKTEKYRFRVFVEDVDRELSTGKYDVFAMVHNETSTGVMSDLESISQLMKEK